MIIVRGMPIKIINLIKLIEYSIKKYKIITLITYVISILIVDACSTPDVILSPISEPSITSSSGGDLPRGSYLSPVTDDDGIDINLTGEMKKDKSAIKNTNIDTSLTNINNDDLHSDKKGN